MPTKDERAEAIKAFPMSSIFLVKRNSLYWRHDNCGYTNDIVEAKIFSRAEVMDRLSSNTFNDKEIIPYSSGEII